MTADAENTPDPIEATTQEADAQGAAHNAAEAADDAAEAATDSADRQPIAEPADAEQTPEVPEQEAGAPEAEAPEAEAAEAEAVESAGSAETEPEASIAAPSEPVEPARPAPAPVPTPSPRPGPRPVPRPAPGAATRPAAAATEPWGRVDDDGTVSVREASGWRVVGEFPDGPADEALAYFERKYTDLASEVTLLEVRHRRGGAAASDLRSTAAKVREKVTGAAAVGDLAALEGRLDALVAELTTATAAESAAAREAVDAAIAERTKLVVRIEALAARDPRSVQWKQTTAEVTSLFEQWQTQQQHDPRLPKSAAQQLWKRFRDARAVIDKQRREFYAELDETHKSARDRKTRLVERAEALAPKGEDGIGAYRDLLDEWKAAGRAGKKVDDALWARFKAAGDALYGARAERANAEIEESREKIEAKRALLTEAAAIAGEGDLSKARSLLTGIQRRWDEIGRIFPRDQERSLDDELRRIEQGVRGREDVDWKRNNPETKARANDMTRQLTDAIAKLENELAAAQSSGDKRAIASASEALEARRAWLKALGG